MTGAPRTKRSVYMEWAKTRSHARFNLATSGLIGVPLAEFPLDLAQLELSAPSRIRRPRRAGQRARRLRLCAVAAAAGASQRCARGMCCRGHWHIHGQSPGDGCRPRTGR